MKGFQLTVDTTKDSAMVKLTVTHTHHPTILVTKPPFSLGMNNSNDDSHIISTTRRLVGIFSRSFNVSENLQK
jgi:hypothetical protein